jgi:hypothetical protein
MLRGISARKEQLLRQRLHQEAEQALPPVSEPFHGRLCQAIRQNNTAATETCPEPARSRFLPPYVSLVATAACLVVIIGGLWYALGAIRNRNVDVAPSQVAQIPSLPAGTPKDPVDLTALTRLGHDALARVDAVVDATTVSPQWAYLDYDARLALSAFADRFPFNTSGCQGKGTGEASTRIPK